MPAISLSTPESFLIENTPLRADQRFFQLVEAEAIISVYSPSWMLFLEIRFL